MSQSKIPLLPKFLQLLLMTMILMQKIPKQTGLNPICSSLMELPRNPSTSEHTVNDKKIHHQYQ